MDHDWRHITSQHGPLVWNVVFRILKSKPEALDCYQDVMLEAFEKSAGKSIDNWAGYLRWLAVRRGLDRLRSRSRSFLKAIPNIDEIPDQAGSSDLVQMGELKDRLRCELSSLPEKQAEAFWLRFIEQMSYAEIAEQMGIESSAVGVLIHRAKPRVQKALSDLQPNTCKARIH